MIASFGVVVGMWLERFLIVVPSLSHKFLPYSSGHYQPRPVEIMIMTSTFAAMCLLYVLFSKFVPIISIWELKAGEHPSPALNPPRPTSTRSGRRTHERDLRLYDDGDAAQRAVNGLRKAGVADSAITVISDQPMEAYEFGEMNRATRIWYIASGGGLVGLVFATWLTRMTELAWPLPTGNMPIVSWWPNLIVIFELTMLGAILATVATLLVTGGARPAQAGALRPRSDQRQDSRRRRNPPRLDDVERALVAAGSPQIKRI